MVSKLQPKQEMFAVNVVKNGGDKVKARKDAGYSTAMTKASQGIDADKLFNHARISLRIAELQVVADKVAKESFSISVEWRLKRLKEISDAGVSQYKDAQENMRYENLAASKGAIETINNMLGVKESNNAELKPINIEVIDAS